MNAEASSQAENASGGARNLGKHKVALMPRNILN